MKKLNTLYKRTKTGAIQYWDVFIDGDAFFAKYGQVGGKETTTKRFVCAGTNVGRANERTPEQQAEFAATTKWEKKLESGFSESPDNVDTATDHLVEVMTARTYDKASTKLIFPVASQPKLDGLRARIGKNGAFSRGNKEWVTIDHVKSALELFFKQFPDYILDGELYNHTLKEDFNKITSLVKKTKPTAKDIDECAEVIQFWVYDVIPPKPMTFNERFKFLDEHLPLVNQAIQLTPTRIADSQEKLDEHYGCYIERGYEGQMIRDLDSQYEHKRSKGLLKRKEFLDEEFEIVEIGEGRGNKAGMAGYAILRLPDGSTTRSNIKGSHEFLKTVWVNRDSLIGKYATCKFFNWTPDGKPRFPYVIKFRDGIGKD